MKTQIFLIIFSLTTFFSYGQLFTTKTGAITFYSKAPLEENQATNLQVLSVLNVQTGEMIFELLMNGFQFQNKLMQKHFNENYIESDKFPKAKFVGKIKDLSAGGLTKKGTYIVTISGKLTMRNITKDVITQGKIVVTDKGITGASSFVLPLKDFQIKVPEVMNKRIAEIVKVMVDINWQAKK